MLVSPGATLTPSTPSTMTAAGEVPPTPESGGGGRNKNTALSDYISDRSWTEALSRLQQYPSEASRPIHRPYGNILPLHEACKLQAPPEVVEALVKAYPPAVRTACVDENSFLPLHFAMQTSSSEAVGPLLKAYPAGARKKDDTGRLPIHVGCEWRADPSTVEALLVSYPESIYVRDEKGRSPVDCAKNPRTKGDNSETVAVMDRGLEYCAVSKSAYRRLKDEFDILMKKQQKSHEAAVANLEKAHADEVNLHRQLEEGYRSGLKSMGEQSNKFRRESVVLKKEKTTMSEKIDILKSAEEVLHAHADALEGRLREKNHELKEARSLGDLRAEKIVEHEHKIEELEVDLGEKIDALDATEKELGETKEKVATLTTEKADLDARLEDMTSKAGSLEEQLEASRSEYAEKKAALEDTLECVESLTATNKDNDERIAALIEQNDALEAKNDEMASDIAAKDSTIESNNERITDLTLKWHSMTDQSREQAKQIASLKTNVASLESDLKERTSELEETSAALAESRGRMEVLLRNLDSVLRHNVEQANRIETLNGTVVSLSTALNAFILPGDVIQKAKVAQAEAMGVLLNDDDKYLLSGKLSESRDNVASVHSSMDELINAVKPAALEGIAWEHYQKPEGDDASADSPSVVSSTPSLNLSASQAVVEQERTIAEMMSSAGTTPTTVTAAAPSKSLPVEEEPVPEAEDGKDEDTEVDSYHHDDAGDMSSIEKEDTNEEAVAVVVDEVNAMIAVEDVTVVESASVDSTVCADEAAVVVEEEAAVQEDVVEAEEETAVQVDELNKADEDNFIGDVESVEEKVKAVEETVEEEPESVEEAVEETVEEAPKAVEEAVEAEPKADEEAVEEVVEEEPKVEEQAIEEESKAVEETVEDEPEVEEHAAEEEIIKVEEKQVVEPVEEDLIRFDDDDDAEEVEKPSSADDDAAKAKEEEKLVREEDAILQDDYDDDNTSVGDSAFAPAPSSAVTLELV